MPEKHEMRRRHRPFNQRVGQVLITLNVVNHIKVIKARQVQMIEKPSEPIGQIMIDLGYITPDDLHRALSIQKDLELK